MGTTKRKVSWFGASGIALFSLSASGFAQRAEEHRGPPGNRWSQPVSLPKTAPEEGEIFSAALVAAGPRQGQLLVLREWNNVVPCPAYIVDPRNLPDPLADVACGTDTPEVRVVCLDDSEIGCSGLSFDRDGRLLAAAGHYPSDDCGGGTLRSNCFNIFDPEAFEWLESPASLTPMNSCRHYPSAIFVPNDPPFGDFLVVVGGNTPSYEIGRNFAVGSLDANCWTLCPTADMPAQLSIGNYTGAYLTQWGLYFSNPGRDFRVPVPTWGLVPTADTEICPDGDTCPEWQDGPARSTVKRPFSGMVFLDRLGAGGQRTQRIVLLGGTEPSLPLRCDSFIGSKKVEWIDDPLLAGAAWAPSPAVDVLQRPRMFAKSIVLPDGKVAVLGGATHDYITAAARNQCELGCDSPDVQATREVEIYDPVTNTSKLRATEPVPRMYHSAAVLLPDGRIASVGGDTTVATPTSLGCDAGQDLTFYSPPYLSFPRPKGISVSSSVVNRGDTIDVFATSMPDGAKVAKVTLTAPGVSTHQTESHERWIELKLGTPAAGAIATAEIPANIWRMPPGYYLLWVVLNTGAVSKAVFIQVV